MGRSEAEWENPKLCGPWAFKGGQQRSRKMPAPDQNHKRLDVKQWSGPGEAMRDNRWTWQSAGDGAEQGRGEISRLVLVPGPPTLGQVSP